MHERPAVFGNGTRGEFLQTARTAPAAGKNILTFMHMRAIVATLFRRLDICAFQNLCHTWGAEGVFAQNSETRRYAAL
jgi:hypothetical protein